MAKKPATFKMTDQIRQLVRDCGVKPAEVARQTGIDKTALSRFLSGERFLSPASLDQLGEFLGIEIVARGPSTKR